MAQQSSRGQNAKGTASAADAADSTLSHPMDQPLEGFGSLFPTTPPPRGEQGVLFADPLSLVDENLGYRGSVARKAAGISYRQLDYWAWSPQFVQPPGLVPNVSIVLGTCWCLRS